MTLTVGIDIGGTSVRAIAFDSTGEEVSRAQGPTITENGGLVRSVLDVWSSLDVDASIEEAGVGVPGQVDTATGDVRLAVNLGIGDAPFPLGHTLTAELGLPVTVENDVKVAALGMHEDLHRRGQAPASLALLNIGTGISAGVVIDGEIFRGSRGMAGEIGHVVVAEGGPICACGQQGCLEAVAAGPALSSLDPDAALAQASRYLSNALNWLEACFDVERIYLGGGVAQSGTPFLESIRQQVDDIGRRSPWARHRLQPEQVELAPIDGSTGPRGGAALARRRHLSLSKQATNGGDQ